MSRVILTAAVEGLADEAVVKTLCKETGIQWGPIYIKSGKGNLDKHLARYNLAARFNNWLVVRDLDRDANCAPELKDRLLPHPSPRLIFRIAVRAVESWLLADTTRLANFLGVTKEKLPANPEVLEDPKSYVIGLARKSRKSDIREDMVPRIGSGGKEGPAYASRLVEFVLYSWQPKSAAENSDSLRRCIIRLKNLKKWKPFDINSQ